MLRGPSYSLIQVYELKIGMHVRTEVALQQPKGPMPFRSLNSRICEAVANKKSCVVAPRARTGVKCIRCSIM